MQTLIKAIETIKLNIEYLRTHNTSTNEEQTKQSLIQPLLLALGYDIFSPRQVVMEAQAVTNPNEHVDYAILFENGEKILIEAKFLDYNLAGAADQLDKYFRKDVSKVAIVTNGNIYRFYTDIVDKNIIDDDSMYYELSIDSLSNQDIAFLMSFSCDVFSSEKQQVFAIKRHLADFAKEIDWSRLYMSTDTLDDVASTCKVEKSYLMDYDIDKSEVMYSSHEDPETFERDIMCELVPGFADMEGTGTALLKNQPDGNEVTSVEELAASKRNVPKRDISKVPEDVVFHFSDRKNTWNGKMRVIDNECVVMAGTKFADIVSYNGHKKHHDFVESRRKNNASSIETREDGTVVAIADLLPLSSPSTAGCIVSGRASNGWMDWKDDNGNTLHAYATGEIVY